MDSVRDLHAPRLHVDLLVPDVVLLRIATLLESSHRRASVPAVFLFKESTVIAGGGQ